MDRQLRASLISAAVASVVGLCLFLPVALVIAIDGATDGPAHIHGGHFVAMAAVLGVVAGIAAGIVVSLVMRERFLWLGMRSGLGSQVGPWTLLWSGYGYPIAILVAGVLGAFGCAAGARWLVHRRRRQDLLHLAHHGYEEAAEQGDEADER